MKFAGGNRYHQQIMSYILA